jgi:hypothetical protein
MLVLDLVFGFGVLWLAVKIVSKLLEWSDHA